MTWDPHNYLPLSKFTHPSSLMYPQKTLETFKQELCSPLCTCSQPPHPRPRTLLFLSWGVGEFIFNRARASNCRNDPSGQLWPVSTTRPGSYFSSSQGRTPEEEEGGTGRSAGRRQTINSGLEGGLIRRSIDGNSLDKKSLFTKTKNVFF